MLDTKLIENALALTAKTMEDMEIINLIWDWRARCEFSIEKFCYYLLSPEFIEKYKKMNDKSKTDWMHESYYIRCFWRAIYEYQLWNEEQIANLLSKI